MRVEERKFNADHAAFGYEGKMEIEHLRISGDIDCIGDQMRCGNRVEGEEMTPKPVEPSQEEINRTLAVFGGWEIVPKVDELLCGGTIDNSPKVWKLKEGIGAKSAPRYTASLDAQVRDLWPKLADIEIYCVPAGYFCVAYQTPKEGRVFDQGEATDENPAYACALAIWRLVKGETK